MAVQGRYRPESAGRRRPINRRQVYLDCTWSGCNNMAERAPAGGQSSEPESSGDGDSASAVRRYSER